MLRTLFSRPQPQQHAAVVDKVAREVEANRRLAIYDRDTGLYAYWYLTMRIDEEAQRAERYGHSFSLMLISVQQGNNPATLDRFTEWLSSRLRSSDLVTHLGDGRYLVLLPETAAPEAQISADRVKSHFPEEISAGVSAFPDDGASLLELLAVAEQRLSGPRLFGLARLSVLEAPIGAPGS
jgi:GGDEF domain-containing protein